jgi:hypothetical protein
MKRICNECKEEKGVWLFHWEKVVKKLFDKSMCDECFDEFLCQKVKEKNEMNEE